MIDLPLWAAIIGYIIGIAGAFGGALAVARSRYNAKTDEEREKYIHALEERNGLLETANERQAKELVEVRREQHKLEGQVEFLGKLVLGKCPWADIDQENGRCRNCNRTAMLLREGLGGA